MWILNLKPVLSSCPHSQNYSSQGRGNNSGGGGDEDYEIPPITPPNHADPSLLHLMDPESGYTFHSLPHNGLLNPYSYPELPAALMMSNMLGQDSHLLSGHNMHSVRFTCYSTSPRIQFIVFVIFSGLYNGHVIVLEQGYTLVLISRSVEQKLRRPQQTHASFMLLHILLFVTDSFISIQSPHSKIFDSLKVSTEREQGAVQYTFHLLSDW